MSTVPQTIDGWLVCLPLPEYFAMIPCGQLRPIVGPIIWVDGTGKHMSKEHYIEKWGFDPQIAWDAVKEYRKQAGKNDQVFKL